MRGEGLRNRALGKGKLMSQAWRGIRLEQQSDGRVFLFSDP